ncbi:hypothetical protein [Rubinisphaera italica]|uniref:DUF3828 domain-containing protein n=1 Tax=Rubinisphaera italica TaxID=2527969 RepID=A0A5C5XHC1_9PLAN|nr:hypothetical protein [Rubinisphaera italica]TWT62224.1 hypothetical protein Pan54_29650 [Rubinisphaera italica]
MLARFLFFSLIVTGFLVGPAHAQVEKVGSKLKDKLEQQNKPEKPAPKTQSPESIPLNPKAAPEDTPPAPPNMKSPAKEKSGSSEKLDRQNAKEIAVACLKAYKKKEFQSLSALSTPGNQEMFAALAEFGQKHPRYNSITSGWRWEAISKWKPTEPLTVRYRGSNTAAVEFGATRSESYVVMLEWVDEQWCFEDINSPDRQDFRSLPKERP